LIVEISLQVLIKFIINNEERVLHCEGRLGTGPELNTLQIDRTILQLFRFDPTIEGYLE
jgi:hypothetical protein